MEIIDVTEDGAQIRLTPEELVVLANSLNEVCNGLDIPEFTTRIGAERSDAMRLLKEIQSAHDQIANKSISR